MIQAIMRMLPPGVGQAVAANPAIIPQLVQKFLPMVLGGMKGAMGGGGAPPPPGGGGGMPPPRAFSGNAPPQPSAQGAIQPMSTEDELAATQQQMGSKKPY
jgi:hypothetical protein